jgi:hypothetical protein
MCEEVFAASVLSDMLAVTSQVLALHTSKCSLHGHSTKHYRADAGSAAA